jgi:hypothetical protein
MSGRASEPRNTHHSHRHLDHSARVGVVDERAALLQLELIDEHLFRLDVRLRHAADAVHPVRQQHAVPMYGRMLRQFVGDERCRLCRLPPSQ